MLDARAIEAAAFAHGRVRDDGDHERGERILETHDCRAGRRHRAAVSPYVCCFGLVLTFGGCAVLHAGKHEWPFVALVLAAGCLASIMFALLAQRVKHLRRGVRHEHATPVAIR
jgi:hypothetical protein